MNVLFLVVFILLLSKSANSASNSRAGSSDSLMFGQHLTCKYIQHLCYGGCDMQNNVPWSARPGQQIGRVQATDQDAGVDGRVVYTLAAPTNSTRLPSSLIGIDPQSGILLLRSPVNASTLNGSDSVELTVVASTSSTQFARATVLIEFDDKAEPFVDPSKQEASVSRLTKIFLAGLLLLLIIIFLFLIVFCARFCATRRRRQPKPRKQIYSVARGNIAVMTNMDRHSPTYARKSISRFSSPTTIAATSLLSSSAMSSSSSDGEKKQVDGRVVRVPASRSSDGVRLRDDQTNVAMSRSHGDSGIDADGISIGSLNDYLNQISARTAFSASKSASTFADPVNAELLNATASDTYRTAVSHSSSGIYDFPMRPTIKPLQIKRNMNNSYVSTMRTFSDPQETNNQQDYLLLHGHAQP